MQHFAISDILEQVINLHSRRLQVEVDPFGESFLLYADSFFLQGADAAFLELLSRIQDLLASDPHCGKILDMFVRQR